MTDDDAAIAKVAEALFERFIVEADLADLHGEAAKVAPDAADVDRIVAAVVGASRAYVDGLRLTQDRAARASYIDKLYELQAAARVVVRRGGATDGAARVLGVVTAEIAALGAALTEVETADGLEAFGRHARLDTPEGQADLVAELVRRGHPDVAARWAAPRIAARSRYSPP